MGCGGPTLMLANLYRLPWKPLCLCDLGLNSSSYKNIVLFSFELRLLLLASNLMRNISYYTKDFIGLLYHARLVQFQFIVY